MLCAAPDAAAVAADADGDGDANGNAYSTLWVFLCFVGFECLQKKY